MRAHRNINWSGIWTSFIAVLATFVMIIGTNVIVHEYILKGAYATMGDIISISNGSQWVFFLVMVMITFFIVELNRHLKESSIAIGLVVSIIFSLPTLLNQFYFAIPAMVTVWTILANVFSITLGSYVYDLIRK